MTARRATFLVARRELGERIRSRGWRISTVVVVTLVAIAGVLAGVLGGDDTTRYDVGAQGARGVAIAQAGRAAAPRFDARLDVRRFRTPDAARAAVRDESVDAAVVGGALLSRDAPPDELEQALQSGARTVRAGAILRAEGVPAAEARRALDPPALRVETLDADPDDSERAGVAFAAALILYGLLIVYGLAVATAVVEEKASRVVEVLLATISPRPLLAGKVIGIGLLGLVQLSLAAVVGLAAAAASGAIELDGDSAATLGVTVIWFLFGYALYACLYAMAGVVVSRQEDLQNSSTVLTIVLVISYLLAFPAIDDPSGTLAVVASLVPLSSPMIMPVRVALGEAGAVEIAASLGLLAASVLLLVPFGARIYEGAVLRMGKPLRLVEALRAARTG